MTHNETVKNAQSEIREILNWVKIYEEEYSLDKEVVETLCSRLEKLSALIAKIE